MDSSKQTTTPSRICLTVDGSSYASKGFDLFLNQFYKEKDQISLIHVFNKKKLEDKVIPFSSQPESIKSNYETKLIGKLPKDKYTVVITERQSTDIHALNRVNIIATEAHCDVIVVGFQGHKANKKKDELTKGIKYLIQNVRMPIFIIKEYIPRHEKKTKGYTWLVCIDQAKTKSFKAFEQALRYIDTSKDNVIGYHVSTSHHQDDECNKQFTIICKENNIENYSFKLEESSYKITIGKRVCDLVNYSENAPDFVVLGHNLEKYILHNKPIEDSPSVEVIKGAWCNCLFYK